MSQPQAFDGFGRAVVPLWSRHAGPAVSAVGMVGRFRSIWSLTALPSRSLRGDGRGGVGNLVGRVIELDGAGAAVVAMNGLARPPF